MFTMKKSNTTSLETNIIFIINFKLQLMHSTASSWNSFSFSWGIFSSNSYEIFE